MLGALIAITSMVPQAPLPTKTVSGRISFLMPEAEGYYLFIISDDEYHLGCFASKNLEVIDKTKLLPINRFKFICDKCYVLYFYVDAEIVEANREDFLCKEKSIRYYCHKITIKSYRDQRNSNGD
jgi:hypothetical protein